jgi:hypothetical protein
MKPSWVLFLLLTLLSCESGFRHKTIENEIYGVSMKVPWYWQRNDRLSQEAVIGASSNNTNSAIFVQLESKLEGDFLPDVATRERDRLMAFFSPATLLESETMTLNGYPAIQYQLRASFQGFNIRYIHTILETDDFFPQVIAWTAAERYDENKEELWKSIQSITIE